MSLGEFDLIARYFTRRAARSDVLLGVGDDAAVVSVPPDRRLVVAMDTLVDGVHFPAGTSSSDIGYRSLAVNLSDLAAMGAQPSWMTLSLALPHTDEAWVAGFAQGLFELADMHGVALIGGDTVRGPMTITVQVAGLVERDRWLTRAGAREGDLIYVSGTIGDAAAGLAVVQQRKPDSSAVRYLRERFLRPTARVELGRTLRPFATAAMDVSDGLLTDLDKLCAASGCGAQIDIDALPLSDSLRGTFDPSTCVDFALAGGDDYELLFTIAPDDVGLVPAGCARIGVIARGNNVECLRDGKPMQVARRGFDHFKDATS